MAEMNNIEIKDFTTVTGVGAGDYIVLSLSNGTGGKMSVSLFRENVASGITPSIKDGIWYIGATDTGVGAEGKTPEFRKGELGIEYKYTTEPDTQWRLLINYADIAGSISSEEITDITSIL